MDRENTLKNEVDQLFDLNKNDQRTSEFLDRIDTTRESYGLSPFGTALFNANSRLGDEEYNVLANEVAKDPRVNTYLPSLALEVMSSLGLDSALQISKERLEALANSEEKFDAVYSRSLKFAVQNFDKFRNFSTTDEPPKFLGFGGGGNQPDISPYDILSGKDFANFSERARRQARSARTILENFDAIDSNHSGKLTQTEGANWLKAKYPDDYQVDETMDAVLPQTTNRKMPGSQELSKADYQKRIAEYEKVQTDFDNYWR